MKSIILFLSLLLSASIFGQVSIKKDTLIKKELSLILSNDSIICNGSNLKTGRGSLPNGDFKYIHTSSSSWVAVMSASQNNPSAGVISLGRRYNGLLLNVKSIKKEGNKKRGYKYIVKVGGGNIVNYEVELEDALATGEVIELAVVEKNSPTIYSSSADELKKLKELYDSGAITKDEYDSAKKKVLAKM